MSARMSARTKTVVTAVSVLLAAGTALAPVAQATAAQGYVSGSGSVVNDWNHEGVLSTGSHSHSNATALWQAVLYADGYLSYRGIDCRFGPNTKSATKKWQTRYMGARYADGVVGPRTFGRAATWLHDQGHGVIRYHGYTRDVWFKRISGKYYVRVSVHKGYKVAWYNSANAC